MPGWLAANGFRILEGAQRRRRSGQTPFIGRGKKRIAIQFSVLPTRPALYSNLEVLAKSPLFMIMLNVFNNAVARPSTVTGADYNQLSTAFFQNVNRVLNGPKSGKDAVIQVETVAKRIVLVRNQSQPDPLCQHRPGGIAAANEWCALETALNWDFSDPRGKADYDQNTAGNFVRRLTTIDYNFLSARFRSFLL